MRRALLLIVLGLPLFASASAHGPVFGLATPTNSQGEWSFDAGIFGRNTALGSQASVRELLAYGITPHLTLSFTLPAVVGDARLPPTRIQPGADFDSTVSWRFQHRATKVGTRFESTAFAGDWTMPDCRTPEQAVGKFRLGEFRWRGRSTAGGRLGLSGLRLSA